jgi:hypothetical protein
VWSFVTEKRVARFSTPQTPQTFQTTKINFFQLCYFLAIHSDRPVKLLFAGGPEMVSEKNLERIFPFLHFVRKKLEQMVLPKFLWFKYFG